jgi:hypothetical protein
METKSKTPDFEIIVCYVRVITEDSDIPKVEMLPVGYSFKYDGALLTALKESNIDNNTLLYDKICCENADYFFSMKCHDGNVVIDRLRHQNDYWSKLDQTFYCPHCGKLIHFVWKNLGDFKLGRIKKEVCSYNFEKIY